MADHEKKAKDLVRQLEFQVEELMEQLEKSEEGRKQFKEDLNAANSKIIALEEEIYGAKLN